MKIFDHLRTLRAVAYRFGGPRNAKCVLCGHALYRFIPYRLTPSRFISAIEMVGSNVRQFQCPWCGGHDRERHLFLYMTAAGLLPDLKGRRVLHFAPEARLSLRIIAAKPARYVRCDLEPRSAEVERVDMLQMPFESGAFDLLLANHVLEHVADDQRALAEIVRVLKPGGHAILQTPFSAKLHHQWADPGINTAEARLEAYGQEDHVRLYGRDLVERFEVAGLSGRVKQHRELLPHVDGVRFGINENEPFLLFQKPEETVVAR